jgi:hypothetical protein
MSYIREEVLILKGTISFSIPGGKRSVTSFKLSYRSIRSEQEIEMRLFQAEAA